MQLFDVDGGYASDDERTVYTDNISYESGVVISVQCNQNDGNFFFLESDECPGVRAFFSIEIGRRGQEGVWRLFHPDDHYGIPDARAELGVRVNVYEGERQKIIANPGVEFSANIAVGSRCCVVRRKTDRERKIK